MDPISGIEVLIGTLFGRSLTHSDHLYRTQKSRRAGEKDLLALAKTSKEEGAWFYSGGFGEWCYCTPYEEMRTAHSAFPIIQSPRSFGNKVSFYHMHLSFSAKEIIDETLAELRASEKYASGTPVQNEGAERWLRRTYAILLSLFSADTDNLDHTSLSERGDLNFFFTLMGKLESGQSLDFRLVTELGVLRLDLDTAADYNRTIKQYAGLIAPDVIVDHLQQDERDSMDNLLSDINGQMKDSLKLSIQYW
jgi:hypothetical protein